MKKILIPIVVGALLAGGVAFAKNEQVTVCHHDQGNNGQDNVTLQININALQAHLNHGDDEGACVTPSPSSSPSPSISPSPSPSVTPSPEVTPESSPIPEVTPETLPSVGAKG